MRKISLDTNAFSGYLTGDEDVLTVISKASIVYMSIFVIAELYFGFKGGNKEEENIENLNIFLSKPTVHLVDATIETSSIFADIKHILKKKGKPIPLNDVWIASHAIETGSVLISYDSHFKNIPGFRIWNKINNF